MSITRLFKSIKSWAIPVVVALGMLASTAALPNVYDEYAPAEYSSLLAANDTTYDDGRFVILKTATCAGGICFMAGPYPAQFTVRWKQDVSQLLLLTYETGFGDALDSAVADSIWEQWGMYTPYAYAVDVPGSGSSELGELGISPAESLMVAEILGFPYKSHPVDNASGWSWLTAYDSSFEYWSDWHYADFQAGAADNSVDPIYFHYYYDRAKTHYNYWWRTGDVQWKRQADSLANEMYRIYYQPNNCHLAPRHYFPEGMWVRYAVGSMVETTVNDSAYRDCIGRWADYLWRTWGDNMTTTQWDDTRGQSRAVLGVMYGALYDTTDTYPFDSLVDNRIALDNLIEMHEFKAGGWDGDHTPAGVGKMRTKAYCWGASAFQTAANVLYTMIMWQERIDKTRIDTVLAITEGALDTISAYWNPTGNFISGREMWATDYVMDPDSVGCSTDPANGLNMLMSSPYAWYFRETGDSSYWHWFDTLTDYGLLQAPNWRYNDGKEYNESYHQTTLALTWLAPATVKSSFTDTNDTLYNPGMGFVNTMGDIMYLQPDEYPATKTAYVRWYWDEVELTEGNFEFAMVDSAIAAAKARGETFAFRLMAASGSGTEIPQWLIDKGIAKGNCTGFDFEPDFADATFRAYADSLVTAFGERYDGNADVEFVDVGMFGTWGEWNLSGNSYSDCSTPIPDDSIIDDYVNMHLSAFPTTPLTMAMGQHAVTVYANANGVGWRGDCFGDWDMYGPGWSHMGVEYPAYLDSDPAAREAWETAPVAFEICYNLNSWLNTFAYGDTEFRATIDSGMAWHGSTVNLKYHDSLPDAYWPYVLEWQRKLGYRFVLDSISNVGAITPDNNVIITTNWTNAGVAPVYKGYRLAFRLRSASDAIAVTEITNANLKLWLPGEYQRLDTLVIADTASLDSYIIDVAILDVSADTAIIKLAIPGLRSDGWYPVSTLRIK